MTAPQLGAESSPQLGFAGSGLGQSKAGRGVGEDEASWAVDGTRQRRIHGEFSVGDRVKGLYKNGQWYLARVAEANGETYLVDWDDGDSQDRVKRRDQLQLVTQDGGENGQNSRAWGAIWKAGDVIGVACDLDRGAMLVSVNGDFAPPNGVAFPKGVQPGLATGPKLFPAFSGRDLTGAYNLGTDPEGYPFRTLPSAKNRKTVEVVRGGQAQAVINADRCTVEFNGLCIVGAPRSAEASGRLYYEIELLQVWFLAVKFWYLTAVPSLDCPVHGTYF